MPAFKPEHTFVNPDFSNRSKGSRSMDYSALENFGKLGENLVSAREDQVNSNIEDDLRSAKHDLFSSVGLGDLYDPDSPPGAKVPFGLAASEKEAKVLAARMKQQTIDPTDFHLKSAALAQQVRAKWGAKWADQLIAKHFGDPANAVVQDLITQTNASKSSQEAALARDKAYVLGEQNQKRIWADLRSAPFRQPGAEDWVALRQIGNQLAGVQQVREENQRELAVADLDQARAQTKQTMANSTELSKTANRVLLEEGINNPSLQADMKRILADGMIKGEEIDIANQLFEGVLARINSEFNRIADEDSFRVDDAGAQISRAGLHEGGLAGFNAQREAALADFYTFRASFMGADASKNPLSLLNHTKTFLTHRKELVQQALYKEFPQLLTLEQVRLSIGENLLAVAADRVNAETNVAPIVGINNLLMRASVWSLATDSPKLTSTVTGAEATTGQIIEGAGVGDGTDSPEVASQRARDSLELVGRVLAGEQVYKSQDSIALIKRTFVQGDPGEFLSHFTGDSRRQALAAIMNPAVSKYIFETVVKDNPELAAGYKNFMVASLSMVPEFKMSAVDLNTAIQQSDGRIKYSVDPNTLRWSATMSDDGAQGGEAVLGPLMDRANRVLDKINPYFELLNGMKDAAKQDPQEFMEDIFNTYDLEVPKSQQRDSPVWEGIKTLFENGDVTLEVGDEVTTSTHDAFETHTDDLSEDKIKLANYLQKVSSETVDSPLTGMKEDNYNELAEFVIAQEGYSSKPYWDVDHLRAGYGSDTTTLEDGSVVEITKDSVVNRKDSQRDLARRLNTEFAPRAKRSIGAAEWDVLTPEARIAITSIVYNYGHVPPTVKKKARSGDLEALAKAVESLPGKVNKPRRKREAALIRSSIDV